MLAAAVDDSQMNPLMLVASAGYSEVFRILLEALSMVGGAEELLEKNPRKQVLERRDAQDYTLLVHAVRVGASEIVAMLVKQGRVGCGRRWGAGRVSGECRVLEIVSWRAEWGREVGQSQGQNGPWFFHDSP